MRLCQVCCSAIAVLILIVGCNSETKVTEETKVADEWKLDRRSWHQGTFAAMSEMVDYGVKKLALGAAVSAAEMDLVEEDALRIAAKHNVKVYRETDFLVTDLFSPSITEGKHVLFFCHESTWQEYQGLKAEKKKLQDAGEYDGEVRVELARRFGRLLSYPEAHIDRELKE